MSRHGLYQPKIADEHIRELYQWAKRLEVPMTRLLNTLLAHALVRLEQGIALSSLRKSLHHAPRQGGVRSPPSPRLPCRCPPKASKPRQPGARRGHQRWAGGGAPYPTSSSSSASSASRSSSSASSGGGSSRSRNSIAPMSQGPRRRRPSWSVRGQRASLAFSVKRRNFGR